MIKTGSKVKFAKMPEWVSTLPKESQRVFQFCLGRVYSIDEVDERGLCVLDVSADVDHRFGSTYNDIRLEPEFLVEIA